MVVIDESLIPSKDYAEYVIVAAKKTIKQEPSLVRQILYTCWSADSKDPINLGIVAPTSEGKSYPVVECIKFVPKDIVWKIGQMSTKVLVRQKGVLVDKEGQPLKEPLKKLDKQILELEGGDKKSNAAQILDLKELRRDMMDDSKMLIDLSGKILVFLEPPQHELWNLLKPILSHDAEEIEFPYVDRTDRTGLVTRKVVVRGWPACIFCSAKDESNWPVWPEVVSRFLIVSPNMNKVKYEESNLLIAQRKSLPGLVLQKMIISNQEIELARSCYEVVRQNISEHSKGGLSGQSSPVWIPYGEILGRVLPSEKGTDTRLVKRIFSFLNIVPLARANIRPKLIFNLDRMIIATLDDLREALYITQNLNGMPAYKLRFFKETFCDLYKTKTAPDSKIDASGQKTEERIAVTSKQLADHFQAKTGKAITTNNLKTTYLNELLNAGYIDSMKSNLDQRMDIYWPIIEPIEEEWSESTNLNAMDNYLRCARLNIPKPYKNIPESWLFHEILALQEYPVKLDKFIIIGVDGQEKTVKEFLSLYQKDQKLTGYFVSRNNSTNFNKSESFVDIIPIKKQSLGKKLSIASKEEHLDNPEIAATLTLSTENDRVCKNQTKDAQIIGENSTVEVSDHSPATNTTKISTNDELFVTNIVYCPHGDRAFPTKEQLEQHIKDIHLEGLDGRGGSQKASQEEGQQ